MVHTQRYVQLKKLAILFENVSKVVDRMAFNEDLPVFDTELEDSLKYSYHDLMNNISQLKKELGL